MKRPDGSEWVLGEGPHGKVLKAMKGGVQVWPSLGWGLACMACKAWHVWHAGWWHLASHRLAKHCTWMPADWRHNHQVFVLPPPPLRQPK